jgi:hypothetical protein
MNFRGHVEKLETNGVNSLVVTVRLPHAECGQTHEMMLFVPKAEGPNWLPGTTVFFAVTPALAENEGREA